MIASTMIKEKPAINCGVGKLGGFARPIKQPPKTAKTAKVTSNATDTTQLSQELRPILVFFSFFFFKKIVPLAQKINKSFFYE